MGLFGGFRAKFTKNSKEKKKHEQVVCVSYIFSEFDSKSPEPSTGRRPRPTSVRLEKNEVKLPDISHKSKSLERLPPPSFPKPPAPQPRGSPPPVPRHSPLLVPRHSPPPLPKSPPPILPKKQSSAPYYSLPPPLPTSQNEGEYIEVTDHSDRVSKRVSFDSNDSGQEIPQDDQIVEYIEIKDIEENRYEVIPKHPKSILKATKNVEDDDEVRDIFDNKDIQNEEKNTRFSDQSPLIFMSQSDSETDSDIKNEESGENNLEHIIRCMKNDSSKEIQSDSFEVDHSQIQDFDDYNEDFKVNIVAHDPEMKFSFSEDELSEDLDITTNEEGDYELVGYSSHAASIFFGDFPPKPKPRKLMLTEGDRNSAEGEC
ncbi:unnamed protein product [Acanthoscelides obtectus]|uniref:Uncharacterized protein n=1 Tax=Acanthoscelides obtectus TaxID=200917 RepID=A0A9P0NSQ3_ACAOB|nr:unnamed protein product [Acanthoscelides obtectus]CAK1678633.1 hypothetical protein AOBTE_LOCUS31975 [Acanthoscelides obtectus]